MKKLIIDAQVIHTPAMHRGMGKYSVELVKSLIAANKKKRYWDSIELVISSSISLDEEAERFLMSIAGSAIITKLSLKKDLIYNSKIVTSHNRKTIDKHINNLLTADDPLVIDYLILGPMQGGISSTFPSNMGVRKSLVCYDLIPFMFHDYYFVNPIAREENLAKLIELLKADTFLTISKTVANDLSIHLGVDQSRIRSIDGGPINHSNNSKKINVRRPFVLMPTGNDIRKNNRLGILGFSQFNEKMGNRYSLLVTSFFEDSEVAELSSLGTNIIFTGNVTNEELGYLYKECEILLFPSTYEGLGLPVLEAVENIKPVACSDISVFREMSNTAFEYFDPSSADSIYNALCRALILKIDKLEYKHILDKYNWPKTANLVIKALGGGSNKLDTIINKPKVALFIANPETESLASKLLQTSYAELSRFISPKFFIEGEISNKNNMRPNLLRFVDGAVNITGHHAVDLKHTELAIYNLENSKLTSKILFTALANPGLIILHDLDLSRAWGGLKARGLIDESRYKLEIELQHLVEKTATRMLCSVVAAQKAVAVFSKGAKKEIEIILEALGLNKPVIVITYPTSSLVYDGITPIKHNFAISFENVSGPKGEPADLSKGDKTLSEGLLEVLKRSGIDVVKPIIKTDYNLEDNLSKAKFSLCNNANEFSYSVAGMRYGSVPIYSSDNDSYLAKEVPAAFIKAYNSTEANGIINKATFDQKNYEVISKSSRDEISREHSFFSFAQDIYELAKQTEASINE